MASRRERRILPMLAFVAGTAGVGYGTAVAGPGLQINSHTIDGGGGNSTGGGLVLRGTIAQWDAGESSGTVSTYHDRPVTLVLKGGFWPAKCQGSECGQDCQPNQTSDIIDIITGTSDDYNYNWMPDKCENAKINTNGLIGTYYDNDDFTGKAMARIDPNINFSWAATAPWPTFSPESFSIRWSGWLDTSGLADGLYTFFALTDDGLRLWVENQVIPIIDQWRDQSAVESSGAIQLKHGKRYGSSGNFGNCFERPEHFPKRRLSRQKSL